jgi:hypothetical protein
MPFEVALLSCGIVTFGTLVVPDLVVHTFHMFDQIIFTCYNKVTLFALVVLGIVMNRFHMFDQSTFTYCSIVTLFALVVSDLN